MIALLIGVFLIKFKLALAGFNGVSLFNSILQLYDYHLDALYKLLNSGVF